MEYKIELESGKGVTKVFVFEGDRLIGCEIIRELTPSKEMVLISINQLLREDVEAYKAKAHLEPLTKEINDELSKLG